jgi:formylglycine-generating enzyme required for sulfatase activity
MMGQVGVTEPVHPVTLTSDYYLGKYEVTNQEYLEAAQWAYDHGLISASVYTVEAYGVELLELDEPWCEIGFSDGQFYLIESSYSNGDCGPGYAYPDGYNPENHPILGISFYGAACYCDWLSQMSGLDPFYNGLWDQTPEHNPYLSDGFRLPTEAEWEYAAQYGDDRTYPWGETAPDCYYANFYDNGYCVGWTAPVGSYSVGASSLGLMDMAGNIWEWVGDRYGVYSGTLQIDPLGDSSGNMHILRGGYWEWGVGLLRCADRYNSGPSTANESTGFRVCRTANP